VTIARDDGAPAGDDGPRDRDDGHVTSATSAMTPSMSQSIASTWLSTGDYSSPST
jgi:hypothetical protein